MLNAGTNDATQRFDVGGAHIRMEKLIFECFAQSPDTVVILSTLIPNGQFNKEVRQINAQYRILAENMAGRGFHLKLAEMDDGFITVEHDIWTEADGTQTHPNVSGFLKMAAVWSNAIHEILKEDGWLKAPSDNISFVGNK